MNETNFADLFALLEAGKLYSLRTEMAEMNEVDVAEFLEELEEDSGTDALIKVFRILPKDISADVFSYLESDIQSQIVEHINDTEVGHLVEDLYTDDVVDFLEEVPANVVTRVLRVASPETRKIINTYLNYPEDSAGSIMTNEMIELHDSVTVQEAINHIREHGEDKVSIYTVYCIDASRHLIGTLELSDLIYNPPEAQIRDIMDDDKQLVYVHTLDDQEDAADLVTKYDLLSVPVVDKENRLVGIITVDDIMDILQEEATEDMERMAAIMPSDKPYMKTGIFETYKQRIPWLLLMMLTATFTSAIITHYESALSAYVVLTAYIPMLTGTGGNAGSQSSVSVIRALSLGDVTFSDTLRVVWKEIRVSVLAGITLAVCNMAKLMVFDRLEFTVALVVCLTLVAVVIISKLIGCLLPLLAERVHLDPTVMASPVVTTLVDTTSLLAYFQIASALLPI